MVQIMQLNQHMLNAIGLRLSPIATESSIGEKIKIVSYSGSLFSLIVSSIMHSLRNTNELLKFVESFYIFGIFAMFLIVYIGFVMGKQTIKNLLETLQRLVDESEYSEQN